MSRRYSFRAVHDSTSIVENVIGNVFKREGEDLEQANLLFYKNVANRAGVVAISECLDKISILCIITQQKIDPAWVLPAIYKPLEQKMTSKDDGYEIFLATSKKKLAKDLTFLTKALNDLIDDVLYGGDVGRLLDALDVFRQEQFDEDQLLKECAKNRALLKKLSYDMRKSSQRNRDAFNRKADEAYQMHEKYEEALGYGTIEYKYNEKYENNRVYLSNYLNTQNEKSHEKTISTYTEKQESENRINKEITSYFEVTMNDMYLEIEFWMYKYDEDVDRLDKCMYQLKVDKEKMELDFAELTKLYAQRQTEIEEWVTFRDQMRSEQDIERKRTEAAIKIQAWWRGVMVRKRLGPYRKRKGKGKGKKGGKGGKGGKDKKGKKKK